jgi:hypothetical protein
MTPHSPLPRPAKTTTTATKTNLVRQNLRVVKQLHPMLSKIELASLSDLTRALHLSVRQGEISYINGKWYVTHAGLLRVALRHRCCGTRT